MTTNPDDIAIETKNSEIVTVQVTKLPHCQVKLEIWVQPEGTAAAYTKAVQKIKKEISIPGFRKGRAPNALLLDKYASSIQSEFVQVVLEVGINEALDLTGIYPLRQGIRERPIVKECSREKGAHFILEFEQRPVLPTIDFKEMHIPPFTPPVITEEEREYAFHDFLHRFMTFEEVNDRGVLENDYIDLDLTLEEEEPRVIAENKRIQVNEKVMPLWLIDVIQGKTTGELIKGITKNDPNNSSVPSTPFHGKIGGIYQGILPPIDDELAKKVGLTTIEELKTKLYKQLNDRTYETAKMRHVDQILLLLMEKFPMDFPRSYIDHYRSVFLEDYKEKLHAAGKGNEIDQPEWVEYIEKNSLQKLHADFLFKTIEKEYGITVTEEDVSREMLHQLGLMQAGVGSLSLSDLKDDDQANLRKKLRDIALDNKIKDFLVDQSTT